jgi:hypothetical protein
VGVASSRFRQVILGWPSARVDRVVAFLWLIAQTLLAAYSPRCLERLSESFGCACNVVLRTTETALFGQFRLRIPAEIAVGALLMPLFGQSLKKPSEKF